MFKDRLVAAFLILFFFALVACYLWWGRFAYHKPILLVLTYSGAIAVILASHLYFRDSLRKLGLRFDNFAEALRAGAFPNLILLGTLLVWGLATQGLSVSWRNSTLFYIPWAFMQQYVLQNFLLARFRTILGNSRAAVIAASLMFALIHLPNSTLVVASLVGALVWCGVFLKVPNLFLVSCAHTLLGILLVVFFKFNGLDQLQVGRSGYAYRAYGDGVLVAAGYDGIGRPFIATLPGPDRGNPSLVRVYGPSGNLRSEWNAFPNYDFSGNLAVGDLGFEKGDEIVVSPGPGSGNPPEIRIFDTSGDEVNHFTLEGYPGYGATVSIADGRILVCPGPGPERTARAFEFLPDGSLTKEWDFGEIGFHNSVCAQRLEVPDKRNVSRLLLWGNVLSVNSSEIRVYDETSGNFSTWKTYDTAFGLNLALIQLKNQERGFVTGPGSAPGHGPRIKVFDEEGIELQDFFGYQDESPCGTHVAAVDLDGDAVDEIVLGEGTCPDQPPIVRVIDRKGRIRFQWKAY